MRHWKQRSFCLYFMTHKFKPAEFQVTDCRDKITELFGKTGHIARGNYRRPQHVPWCVPKGSMERTKLPCKVIFQWLGWTFWLRLLNFTDRKPRYFLCLSHGKSRSIEKCACFFFFYFCSVLFLFLCLILCFVYIFRTRRFWGVSQNIQLLQLYKMHASTIHFVTHQWTR